MVAENQHMFYKCYSAAMWDCFEVTAAGDCISAIKRNLVSCGGGRMEDIDGGQVSTVTAQSICAHRGYPERRRRDVHLLHLQLCSSLLSWYGVDCQRGQVFLFFIPQETSRIRFLIGSVSLVVSSWTFR